MWRSQLLVWDCHCILTCIDMFCLWFANGLDSRKWSAFLRSEIVSTVQRRHPGLTVGSNTRGKLDFADAHL